MEQFTVPSTLEWCQRSMKASHFTGNPNVYANTWSGLPERNHQDSTLLSFVREIKLSLGKSPHRGQLVFPCCDIIIKWIGRWGNWWKCSMPNGHHCPGLCPREERAKITCFHIYIPLQFHFSFSKIKAKLTQVTRKVPGCNSEVVYRVQIGSHEVTKIQLNLNLRRL